MDNKITPAYDFRQENVEMGNYKIINIKNRPELIENAAVWFQDKWRVPADEYRKSMEESFESVASVPQWYLVMEGSRITGGAGVIQNDFHKRKDLTPNVCALYVEEDRRCCGIAGALLQFICEDMRQNGIHTLYLITDHTSFYERYGWEYLCMVEEDEGGMIRMYIHKGKE